jgi:hypothetical protein
MATELPATGQTLWFDEQTRMAILVTRNKRRYQKKHLRFKDGPHAALDWCIEQRACFVFMPSPPVSHN